MGNIDIRNPRTLGIITLVVVALVVGMIAYSAGVSQGLATTAIQTGRGAGPVIHHGGFGIFGFLGFLFNLLIFAGLLALLLRFLRRGPFGRGPWSGDWQSRREEKMREWLEFQDWRRSRAAASDVTQSAAPRQDPPQPSGGNAVV